MTAAVKLLVRDKDDIEVVSALLQDALCAPEDMSYDKAAGEFLAVVNRFCWEQPATTDTQGERPVFARAMAGLRVGGVISVQQRGMEARSGFYNLLAIEYEKPDQRLRLIFSAGAEVQLQLSELRLVVADLSADYPTAVRPAHDTPKE